MTKLSRMGDKVVSDGWQSFLGRVTIKYKIWKVLSARLLICSLLEFEISESWKKKFKKEKTEIQFKKWKIKSIREMHGEYVEMWIWLLVKILWRIQNIGDTWSVIILLFFHSICTLTITYEQDTDDTRIPTITHQRQQLRHC